MIHPNSPPGFRPALPILGGVLSLLLCFPFPAARADEPPLSQPGQLDSWPLVLPVPQRMQYGQVIQFTGWNYAAPRFSSDLNAEIADVCGASVAGGLPIVIEILTAGVKGFQHYTRSAPPRSPSARTVAAERSPSWRLASARGDEFLSPRGYVPYLARFDTPPLGFSARPCKVELASMPFMESRDAFRGADLTVPDPSPVAAPTSFPLSSTVWQQEYRLSITPTGATLRASAETGIYYALQSLRALQYTTNSLRYVRAAEIHDWPTFENRGMIMGPGRSPRSSRIKMNLLQYAWGKTPFNQAFYAAEVASCRRYFVRFMTFDGYQGRFNGQTLTYDAAGYQMLRDIYTAHFNLGSREFLAAWDDMSLPAGKGTEWGTNHATAVKVIYDTVKALDPKSKVYFVPVPYGGTPSLGFVFSRTADAISYLQAAGQILPDDVYVLWTGQGVFSPTVTNADADSYGALIGRPPFMWDNDMLSWAGKMLPLSGRPLDYNEHASGWTGNWMNGIPTMRVGFFPIEISAADYLWNPRVYDSAVALQRAYRFVGGTKAAAVQELWETVRAALPPTNQEIPQSTATRLTAGVQGVPDQEFANDLVAYMQQYIVPG